MLLRTRLRYPAIFSIDGEPAIDSGGVTNEVVSLALNEQPILSFEGWIFWVFIRKIFFKSSMNFILM